MKKGIVMMGLFLWGIPVPLSPALGDRPSLVLPGRWPVFGLVTSPFGWRAHPIYGRLQFHKGVDLKAPLGVPVRATSSGKVIFAGWRGEYGRTVMVDQGKGWKSVYGHLGSLKVQRGQEVKKGAILGCVGESGLVTGPHLHFEVSYRDAALDPEKLLSFKTE